MHKVSRDYTEFGKSKHRITWFELMTTLGA
jgi:hypothetical protein